jgi:hypothetical protein
MPVALAACDHSAAIAFVQFIAIVGPADFSSDLASILPTSIIFLLKLPQLPIPENPKATVSADELQAIDVATATSVSVATAMKEVIDALVARGAIGNLDMSSLLISSALSTIVDNSSAITTIKPCVSTPTESTKHHLFPDHPPHPGDITSLSNGHHLTHFHWSNFLRPLDFFNNQLSLTPFFFLWITNQFLP